MSPLDAIRAGLLSAVELAKRFDFDPGIHGRLEAAAAAVDVLELLERVRDLAGEAGALGVALSDIELRAAAAFGGKPVPDEDALRAWIETLAHDAPHLFGPRSRPVGALRGH